MQSGLESGDLPQPPEPSGDRKPRCEKKLPGVPPLSIYHETWWLDIATDGRWGEAKVVENGTIIGRMPYSIETRRGLRLSRPQSLIRTLGPAILAMPGKPVATLRRRLAITNELIDQLPAFDMFEQLFDPAIPDAVSFIYRGFTASVVYAFWIDAGLSEAQIWSGMNDKTRNVIRKCSKSLSIGPIDEPDAFVRFYEENLDGTPNIHGTRRLTALLEAMLSRHAGILLGTRDETGRLMAATAIPWDSKTAYFLLSTRRRDAAAGATNQLMWEAARLACARSLAFDLDGVTSPASLLFLSGFGGRMVQRLRVRRHSARFRIAKRLRLVGY
jgi:hypothetical protein